MKDKGAVSKVVEFTDEIAHSEQKIMVNREMVVQELYP
jgi:hypothetical protein